MSFIIRASAVLAAAISLATAAQADGIEVHDAYAIAATPTAMSGGAFMIIHNHGGAPDRLIDVRSDAAEMTQLHTSVEDANGVMQMLHVEDGFDLPTDGQIELARGGDHIMFMGLRAPFVQDEVLTVTLVFENAGDVVIEVPVDLARLTEGAADMGAMEGMDHGSMSEEAPATE